MSNDLPDDDEFQAEFSSTDARAKEARNAALTTLADIDPDDPNTSKIDVLEGEEAAVSTWAKHAAMAAEDGHPTGALNAHAGAIAKATQHFTKRDTMDMVENQRQRLTAGGSGGSGPPRLDAWVENNLNRVIRLETTDRTQDTVWRWDFSDGTIETATTKDGITHFSWTHFRDAIYTGLGVNTQKPERAEAEEWRQWLADLIQQYEEVRETFGPRSHAVERLQGFIEDSMAYGDKSDAVERDAVYLDADPNNGTPSEIWVKASDVKRIADDVEVHVRALQQELDAQGFTLQNVNGVSDGEYVNGQMVRFWRLDPDIADPVGYMDSAQSPAQQVQNAQNGNTPAQNAQTAGGSGGASTGGSGGGVATDGTQLASIGPDTGDDSDDGDDSDTTDDNDDEQNAQSDEQNAQDAQSDDSGGGGE